MKYKGIIFDLDGTLLYTIEDISDSMNEVLIEYGRDVFTYEEYKQKIGGGFRNLVLNSFGRDTDGKLVDEALKKLEAIYSKNYMNKTKAYDGIVQMLETLIEKNIKMAINTNKRDDYSKALANELFKGIDFIDIIGQDDNWEIKPNPYGANIIMEKMELERKDIIYVGDSNVDILTSKNAGMDSIGVEWGYRGEKELKQFGATYIAYTPKDILDVVL